jgi:sulfoacetaldehyde acetyltransferase
MAATDNRKVVEGVHKMTPSEAFVETCVANGVSEMFGIMGSAFMDAMDIFAPAGIRLIPVVHEQGAAHMADGYARVSGRHGVVIGQNGPGISNCVTGIAAAYWAHSPVVIVTPETGTMGMGLGGFQEANQLPMFQEFTKYQGHVCNPKRMAEFTGRVFDRAMSEMGPTQLNIPRDYFYGEIECEIPSPCAWTAAGRRSQPAGRRGAAQDRQVPGDPGRRRRGHGRCRRGSQALAERLGAPVVNSYLRNDAFPAKHPLWAGPLGYQGSKAAMKLIAQADVVVALGSRLGPFGTLPQHGMDYWPKTAKIIQIDADHTMLGLVKKISVGINGDAKAVAAELRRRLADVTLACDATKAARADTIATEKAAWEKELDELDPRARPLQPGHDRRAKGEHADRRQLSAPAPGAARAGKSHAGRRDGVHRHRQHQLGGQQLSALRRAAQLLRGHELRQLRLCPPTIIGAKCAAPTARPSPMPATAPGA